MSLLEAGSQGWSTSFTCKGARVYKQNRAREVYSGLSLVYEQKDQLMRPDPPLTVCVYPRTRLL